MRSRTFFCIQKVAFKGAEVKIECGSASILGYFVELAKYLLGIIRPIVKVGLTTFSLHYSFSR